MEQCVVCESNKTEAKQTKADNQHEFAKQLQRFTVGDDCPVFDGLYDYCRVYTGGSIDGAMKLNAGISDRL